MHADNFLKVLYDFLNKLMVLNVHVPINKYKPKNYYDEAF